MQTLGANCRVGFLCFLRNWPSIPIAVSDSAIDLTAVLDEPQLTVWVSTGIVLG